MARTRSVIVKRYVPKASKNKKRKAEEVSRSSKKKKIVIKETKSNSDSDTMVEIDNYEDSSAQATDVVECSEEKTDSGDEESSRDSRDSGDEDDDPLSLPFCTREISAKSYNLTTWMDELESFPAKISVRARMTLYRDFRKLLVWIYETFPHLGKYAKNSLDSPLPILRLLRWHTTKSDNIIEVDEYFAEEVNEVVEEMKEGEKEQEEEKMKENEENEQGKKEKLEEKKQEEENMEEK
uniref:Uncharacterized protein n=1 Tax=Solanum tuberosum TaxID=4113 RepID=M1DI07_SOLTU